MELVEGAGEKRLPSNAKRKPISNSEPRLYAPTFQTFVVQDQALLLLVLKKSVIRDIVVSVYHITPGECDVLLAMLRSWRDAHL